MSIVWRIGLILLRMSFSNNLARWFGNKLIGLYEITRFFGLLGLGMSMIVDSFYIKKKYESLNIELEM